MKLVRSEKHVSYFLPSRVLRRKTQPSSTTSLGAREVNWRWRWKRWSECQLGLWSKPAEISKTTKNSLASLMSLLIERPMLSTRSSMKNTYENFEYIKWMKFIITKPQKSGFRTIWFPKSARPPDWKRAYGNPPKFNVHRRTISEEIMNTGDQHPMIPNTEVCKSWIPEFVLNGCSYQSWKDK